MMTCHQNEQMKIMNVEEKIECSMNLLEVRTPIALPIWGKTNKPSVFYPFF